MDFIGLHTSDCCFHVEEEHSEVGLPAETLPVETLSWAGEAGNAAVRCSRRGAPIRTLGCSLNSRTRYVRGRRVQRPPRGERQPGPLTASCSGYSAEMVQAGNDRDPRSSWRLSSHLPTADLKSRCHLLQESREFGTWLIQLHFSARLPVKQQGLPHINIFSETWYYSLLPVRFSISNFLQLLFHSMEKPDVFLPKTSWKVSELSDLQHGKLKTVRVWQTPSQLVLTF